MDRIDEGILVKAGGVEKSYSGTQVQAAVDGSVAALTPTTVVAGTSVTAPAIVGSTSVTGVDVTGSTSVHIASAKHTVAHAAPTTGAHVVGEVVWNDTPAASGTMGWVCTTAGTPGTWKTFGAIAA